MASFVAANVVPSKTTALPSTFTFTPQNHHSPPSPIQTTHLRVVYGGTGSDAASSALGIALDPIHHTLTFFTPESGESSAAIPCAVPQIDAVAAVHAVASTADDQDSNQVVVLAGSRLYLNGSHVATLTLPSSSSSSSASTTTTVGDPDIVSVALTADRRWALLVTSHQSASVYALPPLSTTATTVVEVAPVATTPAHQHVSTAYMRQSVDGTGILLLTVDRDAHQITSMAISLQGGVLGRVMTYPLPGKRLSAVAFSERLDALAVGTSDGRVMVLDVSSGHQSVLGCAALAVPDRLRNHAVTHLAILSPSSVAAVLSAAPQTVYLYHAAASTVASTSWLRLPTDIEALAAAGSLGLVYALGRDGFVHVMDLMSPTPVALGCMLPSKGHAFDGAMAKDALRRVAHDASPRFLPILQHPSDPINSNAHPPGGKSSLAVCDPIALVFACYPAIAELCGHGSANAFAAVRLILMRSHHLQRLHTSTLFNPFTLKSLRAQSSSSHASSALPYPHHANRPESTISATSSRRSSGTHHSHAHTNTNTNTNTNATSMHSMVKREGDGSMPASYQDQLLAVNEVRKEGWLEHVRGLESKVSGDRRERARRVTALLTETVPLPSTSVR